jgi:proteasomal ATPase-associated factor 1
MVVCGPDGYCVVVPCGPDARIDEKVELKGHVGDVIDAKWFPSGEVSHFRDSECVVGC